MRRLGLVFALLLTASAAGSELHASDAVEVRLRLPQRAALDLMGEERLLVAPFITLSQEGEGRIAESDLDVQQALAQYLERVVRRETSLHLVEIGPLEYPTYDLELLSRDRAFWRAVGARSQTDLILAGSIDFDVQDRSGYRVEEYPSPLDGRTMFRQVLVEQTGYELDIFLLVIEGATGEVLVAENFKDFKAFESAPRQTQQGFFENLYGVEERLVGLFVPREVEASRLLLVD